MKKLKFLTIFVIIAFVCSLVFFNVGAAEVTKNIDALTNKNVDITTISGGKITVIQDVSSLVKSLLGETGGNLTANISYRGTEEANISITYKINPSSTLTLEQANGAVSIEITFTVGDESKLTELKITSASVSAYPTESATPTIEPTEEITPTPTGAPATLTPSPTTQVTPAPTVEPTATFMPTETATETPINTLTPTATPTPSPTVTVTPTATPKPTVRPTRRPTATPNRTDDNYTSNWQTQAPPTLSLSPDATVDPNLSTPVPQKTPEPFEKVSNSPSLSFIVLLLILVFFLIVDIILIIWRKKTGSGVVINNGIARRKVRNDLVNTPENAESSDFENEAPQEE